MSDDDDGDDDDGLNEEVSRVGGKEVVILIEMLYNKKY